MHVGIDVSPLQSGHRVRGVGFYLRHLLDALEDTSYDLTITQFQARSEIPEAVDLIHYPYFDPFSPDISYSLKAPVVVTVHDLVQIMLPEKFPSGIKGSFRWRSNKKKIRSVQSIITDSNTAKQDIQRILGVNGEVIHTVHLAPGSEFKKIDVTSPQKEKMRKKYSLPDTFCLYVGDVTANKNLPFLLRACIKGQIPLVLIGKALTDENIAINHPWNKDVVLARHLISTNSNLKALGFVPTEDLVLLYNIAECLIMPSRYEGFGLPVVEAMASFCPVLCSDIPTFKEIAGDTPLYFNPTNESDLLEKIRMVFQNEDEKDSLRSKGAEQVRQYTWEKTAQQTVNVYRRTLNS